MKTLFLTLYLAFHQIIAVNVKHQNYIKHKDKTQTKKLHLPQKTGDLLISFLLSRCFLSSLLILQIYSEICWNSGFLLLHALLLS